MRHRRVVNQHTSPSVHAALRRERGPQWIAIIAAAGLAIGTITQVLQGFLPDGWGVLANSGVMWALMAFALGAALPNERLAAAGGASALVIASTVYYAAVDWFEGTGSDPRSAIIWSAAGIVAGPVFAIAGHWCFHRAGWRYHALALVGGVLFGEGTHLGWLAGNPGLRPAGIVELAIASALLTFCFARAPRTAASPVTARLVVSGVTVAAALSTLVAFELIDAAFKAS